MYKKVLLLPNAIPLPRLLPNIIPALQLAPISLKPPSCKDCLFSISNTKNNQLRCTKFYAKNKSKKYSDYDYEYAIKCRNDETKCGKNGRYFLPIITYY
jgi:hypothetical protein